MADDFDVEEMLEAPFKKEAGEDEVSLKRSGFCMVHMKQMVK